MTVGAILHGEPEFTACDERSPGALGYAADVFALIAGAERYAVRSFVHGAPSTRDCSEADRDWAELLRDLQLRDEPLPTLVVRSRSGGAMFIVFGRHGGPLAVIRLHADGARGFRPAQIAATRRFLDEHGAPITHWVVDGAAPEWRRNSAPVTFVIDEYLRPVLAEEPAGEDSPLHALYRPRDGHTPLLLADTLGATDSRARAGLARHRRDARAAVRVRASGAARRRIDAVLSGLRRTRAPPRHGAARDDALRPEPPRRPSSERSAARLVEHGDRRVAVDLELDRDLPPQAAPAQDDLAKPHRARRPRARLGRGNLAREVILAVVTDRHFHGEEIPPSDAGRPVKRGTLASILRDVDMTADELRRYVAALCSGEAVDAAGEAPRGECDERRCFCERDERAGERDHGERRGDEERCDGRRDGRRRDEREGRAACG